VKRRVRSRRCLFSWGCTKYPPAGERLYDIPPKLVNSQVVSHSIQLVVRPSFRRSMTNRISKSRRQFLNKVCVLETPRLRTNIPPLRYPEVPVCVHGSPQGRTRNPPHVPLAIPRHVSTAPVISSGPGIRSSFAPKSHGLVGGSAYTTASAASRVGGFEYGTVQSPIGLLDIAARSKGQALGLPAIAAAQGPQRLRGQGSGALMVWSEAARRAKRSAGGAAFMPEGRPRSMRGALARSPLRYPSELVGRRPHAPINAKPQPRKSGSSSLASNLAPSAAVITPEEINGPAMAAKLSW
jgi:hypothetical protein